VYNSVVYLARRFFDILTVIVVYRLAYYFKLFEPQQNYFKYYPIN